MFEELDLGGAGEGAGGQRVRRVRRGRRGAAGQPGQVPVADDSGEEVVLVDAQGVAGRLVLGARVDDGLGRGARALGPGEVRGRDAAGRRGRPPAHGRRVVVEAAVGELVGRGEVGGGGTVERGAEDEDLAGGGADDLEARVRGAVGDLLLVDDPVDPGDPVQVELAVVVGLGREQDGAGGADELRALAEYLDQLDARGGAARLVHVSHVDRAALAGDGDVRAAVVAGVARQRGRGPVGVGRPGEGPAAGSVGAGGEEAGGAGAGDLRVGRDRRRGLGPGDAAGATAGAAKAAGAVTRVPVTAVTVPRVRTAAASRDPGVRVWFTRSLPEERAAAVRRPVQLGELGELGDRWGDTPVRRRS